ncbi:hypothetical protein DSO57_1008630 [Entomophthora muscae]|uniref:Uncharacterized protein n=1 Tax=Entomophthora muscae TaxID=34485 RepID=A0ACC2TUU4_9FUNG|nr:hypothetical protein DSO57_1008630 [Entomophthora muscae]
MKYLSIENNDWGHDESLFGCQIIHFCPFHGTSISEDVIPTQLVPDFDPGHTLVTSQEQDYHSVAMPLLVFGVINDISILVLKTQELSPSSQKTDQTLQDSPGPANPLSHRLKLMNYSATCQPTTENSLNSCQSVVKLVPMKTHIYKGDVTWLTEVGEGPAANLPNANTGVLKPTLETLESNPDPPKTT